jgi:hypothetical protein
VKSLSILAAVICLAARAQSSPGEYATFMSPSGQLVARAGIAGAEASPSTRFRVRFVFETATKKALGEIWTGYAHHWAATWSDDDVFLVCGINEETDGLPFEFGVIDFTKKGDGRREPTASERAKVLAEYQRKYAHEKKEPNQSPEPTR